MKRVVVTGASGFIGQALVRTLMDRGCQVAAVGRRPLAVSCRQCDLDLREPEVLEPLLDDETTVFHLAGHTSVAGSVADPHNDFECNMAAFLEVLLSVRQAGARLILPSSPAVFAPDQPLPLGETASKRPTSPYGAAKLACEGYAQSFHACYGVDVRIARIFNVYGPGMTRFAILDFWKKVRQNPEQMEILGTGQQIRDYLFLDDAVQALLLIAERGLAGEDYNVASGVPVRTLDLARQVATCMGYPDIRIAARGQTFPGDVSGWYGDIRKLAALGFQVTTGLLDGLRRTVTWLDHQIGARPVETGATSREV